MHVAAMADQPMSGRYVESMAVGADRGRQSNWGDGGTSRSPTSNGPVIRCTFGSLPPRFACWVAASLGTASRSPRGVHMQRSRNPAQGSFGGN